MFDPLLAATSLLLIITLGASLLYYRKLRKVLDEYGKAKGIVEDIVVSFNRQLERDEDKLATIMQKTEALVSRNDRALKRLEAHEKQISELRAGTQAFLEQKDNVSNEITELNEKFENIKATQDSLTQRIAEVEKTRSKTFFASEAKIEAAIPLRKERVLAPLTETELAVLEMLANEGEKTAPEIKSRIGLTREHTARLMKKLYEKGYVERNSNKIPYTYRTKEELTKLLKKPEAKV